MVPGDSLTEKAEKLARWGYEAIAVFEPLETWNDASSAELVDLEGRTGVKPVEFVLQDEVYGKAMSLDPALREQCRDMYRRSAEVCAEIGAVMEIEYEYGSQDPLPLFDPYQQLTADQRDAFVAFYRELLIHVEGSRARVLLEPINRYESRYLNCVIDNLAVIEEAAHPQAGLLPDLFHLSIEEGDPAASLRGAGDQVAHVHLGDSNRLLPGSGHLDWPSIIEALRDIRYDGYLNLECSTEGDPEKSLPATARFLRDLL
nr:sugar phosphate isomerase/epimerase family protein [Brachybacterium sacelli]